MLAFLVKYRDRNGQDALLEAISGASSSLQMVLTDESELRKVVRHIKCQDSK